MEAQQIAAPHPHHKHGGDGNDHGHPHVTGGPQGVGHGEGQGPKQHCAAVVDEDEHRGVPLGLRRQAVEAQDEGQTQQQRSVEPPGTQVGELDQPLGVGAHLIPVSGPHTLAHHGDESKAQGLAGNDAEIVDVVSHGVGGGLGRAEGGDQAHQQHPAQLKEAVFQAVGHADAENLGHDRRLESEAEQAGHPHGVAPAVEQGQHESGGRDAGQQGGEGHARHTLVEHEHKDSVARNVLPVHVGGDAHGGLGVAHGPQQGGAAVVDGDEGIGEGGDDKVGDGPLHHLRLHLAEQQAQQPCLAEKHQNHDPQGSGGDDIQKLVGCPVGPLQVLGADGLGAHHRAPGGQGGKDVDDQDVDEIHQRHAGDCGLSGGGDHHDVRHTHHDSQKLFDN